MKIQREINHLTAKKTFSGAYSYTQRKNLFAEEKFEVYFNSKNITTMFFSEITARVSTGQLLILYVEQIFTKNWLPKEVIIKKSLGSQAITESFIFSQLSNTVKYTLDDGKKTKTTSVQTPPKFHIGAPTTVASFAFMLAKKFTPDQRNNFSIVNSTNIWKFRKSLQVKNLSFQRTEGFTRTVRVNNKILEGTWFKVWNEDSDKSPPDCLYTLMSKHLAIPYHIEQSDNVTVQIQYLVEHEDDDEL